MSPTMILSMIANNVGCNRESSPSRDGELLQFVCMGVAFSVLIWGPVRTVDIGRISDSVALFAIVINLSVLISDY
jgi:hypothetical protein